MNSGTLEHERSRQVIKELIDNEIEIVAPRLLKKYEVWWQICE